MTGTGDGSLLELFREEVRTNVQILNDGLVALEQDPGNIRRIEPLMRAAHSVKGAARVVNIDAAVTLAHAAEDCLVAAQEGRITLAVEDIDALLEAADLLAGIGESAGPNLPQWLAQSGEEIEWLSSRLGDRARGAASERPIEPAAGEPAGTDSGEEPASSFEMEIEADRSRTFESSPMIGLFREEAKSGAGALRTGLAELEREASNLEALDPAIRAAASVKSAAKLVNVQLAAAVAGIVETILAGARKGETSLGRGSVERLSRLADALEGIAAAVGPEYSTWLEENSEALREMSGDPAALDKVLESGSSVPDVGATASEPDEPVTSTGTAGTVERPREAEAGSHEQVVRVTAQSLTRLMGLAGESLVEARWLAPFSTSLLELKRRQALLADTLEDLRQSLSPEDAETRRSALVADAGERLAECRRMLASQIDEFENRARNADDLNSRLYNEVIASRMRPFHEGVRGFPRMVRDLARQLDKKVAFKIRGASTDVDRDILEKLEAPLNHILRNALDHGQEGPSEREESGKPETGRLEIEARHNAGMLAITVSDDGRGIDLDKIRARVVERRLADEQIVDKLSEAELLEFLFLPAFSTADGVTEVSGRGVGLDVVHSMVHSVGGSVRVQSSRGQGTTFQLEMPITLSVIRAVLVTISGEPYAFPHNRIDRLVRVSRSDLNSLENRQHFEVDGINVGIVSAARILEMDPSAEDEEDLFAILFSHHSDQYGLIVERFCGERDLVVRPLDPRLGKVPNINAAAILDDGSPVLIVDLDDMRRSIERKLHGDEFGRVGTGHASDADLPAKRILVVDDSITVREVQRQLLVNRGYEVNVAVDGMEGWNILGRESYDLVITDIDMPRLNGIDLVRMIKEDARLRSTPVVIVSYKDREADRLRGMEAGADYYLTKSSFHDETLLGAVEELIGEARL